MADPSSLFREEALKHWAGHHQEGEILRLSPAWTRWAYWVLAPSTDIGNSSSSTQKS